MLRRSKRATYEYPEKYVGKCPGRKILFKKRLSKKENSMEKRRILLKKVGKYY